MKRKSTVSDTVKKEHIKKNAVINALIKTMGNVTQACKMAKIHRSTFYKWEKDDPEFVKRVQETESHTFDFVESKIMRQIQDDNTTMIIFYAKTKMKKRGYVEKSELTIDKVPDIVVFSDEDRELLEKLKGNDTEEN